MSTVAIIGTGWVGSSTAISMLHAGITDTLLLNDAREGLAEGEAMDLRHGGAFYPQADVRDASLDEIRDADVIVIAAGRGSRPGQTRLDLLSDNAALTRQLAARLHGIRGVVIVVTNPVDVLVRIFQEASGLPPERVISTGTVLDTARLRQIVGARQSIDPRSIHAQVIGEHGDSSVTLWSSATIGGQPLRSWPGWSDADEAPLAEQVRRAAYEIVTRKGATNHAIGLVTTNVARAVLRDERRVLNVCRVQPCGVAYSMPAVVGAEGATLIPGVPLDDAERAALQRSVAVLQRAYDSVA